MSDSPFTKIPEFNYSEEAVHTNFFEFKKVVESRRSVRVFETDPVPDTIVQECLEMALLSPNSSNLQAWEFYWIQDPVKKEKLAKFCFNQPAARTAPVLIVSVARTRTWRQNAKEVLKQLQQTGAKDGVLDYYRKLVPIAYAQGPLGIFGFFKKLAVFFIGFFTVIARSPLSHGEMKLWAQKTCALACQTLMLAFRAAGYDTCPMEGFDEVRVRKLLGLPRDASVVMVISAGKRAKNGVYGRRMRLPQDLFIKKV